MSNNPILVIGATGKTGRRVVTLLEQQHLAVRPVSRKSAVPFDWRDETTWPAALKDVKAAYIVHAGLGGPGAADQVGAFAKLAAAAGVTKAVLVATPDDGSEFSQSMRDAERHIVDAGLNLTSLRLRWFHQNFSEDFLFPAVQAGELRLPAGTGKEAFVDADDIAEVGVAALTDEHHNGKMYELTGPELLTFHDIARQISQATGQDVTYVPVDPEKFVAEQQAMGVPDEWAYTLSGLYQDIAQGKLQIISGDIESVLGKPARNFASFAAEMARQGIWAEPKA